MTFEAVDLDRLRTENVADLATLREVVDLVALLRPRVTPDGEILPTVWWLTTEDNDKTKPVLWIGLRGNVGFLKWFGDDNICEVPMGTELRDGEECDYFLGSDIGAVMFPSEEIASEYVYAAAVQFVATGQRPTCIQWMNEADVPNYLPPPPPREQDPMYMAIKAALDDACPIPSGTESSVTTRDNPWTTG